MNRFGRYIAYLRNRRQLTTRALAAILHCSQASVTQIERGQRSTTPLKIWQLIHALDGDYRYALAALAVDYGVPEEVAAEVAGESWALIEAELAASSSSTP